MKFNKEILQELVSNKKGKIINIENNEFEIMENKMYDTSRWSINYNIIFKYDNKFYSSCYSRGATEHQDESPYEYKNNEIECTEVIPVEKIIIDYVIKHKYDEYNKRNIK